VDAKHEGKTLSEIIRLPPSALQGLSEKVDPVFEHFKIDTIEKMGNWKFYRLAVAIVDLSKYEAKGKRDEKSRANINKAVDKKHEKSTLKAIAKSNLSAFQGLTAVADEKFSEQGITIHTIGDLAKNKFFKMAKSLADLAECETADMASQ